MSVAPGEPYRLYGEAKDDGYHMLPTLKEFPIDPVILIIYESYVSMFTDSQGVVKKALSFQRSSGGGCHAGPNQRYRREVGALAGRHRGRRFFFAQTVGTAV